MFQTFYWNETIVWFSFSQSYYVCGTVLLMLFPIIPSNVKVEFSSLRNEIKVVIGHKPTVQRGITENTKHKGHLPLQLLMLWPIRKEHNHHGVLPSLICPASWDSCWPQFLLISQEYKSACIQCPFSAYFLLLF